MGSKGGSAPAPPPVPQQTTSTMDQLGPMLAAMSMQNSTAMNNVPQAPEPVPLPEKIEREKVDFTDKEAELRKSVTMKDTVNRSKQTGRRDTIRTSLLDEDYGATT